MERPAGAQILDAKGGFLVTGLIDCFAALNHQGQANAFLAMGVTSILGVESTRRGPLDRDSDPSPHIFLLGEVGYEAAPLAELLDEIEHEKAKGADVLLAMYRIDPDQMLPELAADTKAVQAYGVKIAAGGAALIPTLSLDYLDRPGHANPWEEPVAAILDARDIHWPADPTTGEHAYSGDKAAAYRTIAQAEMTLDANYFQAGCRYLAGSGADVWGTMPGISLHHELAALVEVGHSPVRPWPRPPAIPQEYLAGTT